MAIIKNPVIVKDSIKVATPKTNNGFLKYDSANDNYTTTLPDNQVADSSDNIVSSSAVFNYIAGGIPYITTAPTSDNTNGRLIPVILDASLEASTTQYDGYIYIFKESNS